MGFVNVFETVGIVFSQKSSFPMSDNRSVGYSLGTSISYDFVKIRVFFYENYSFFLRQHRTE